MQSGTVFGVVPKRQHSTNKAVFLCRMMGDLQKHAMLQTRREQT